MYKCVRDQLVPRVAMQNSRAIKLEPREKSASTKGDHQAADDHRRDMCHHEHRRHVDGIAAHPRNGAIIIGGGYSEHERNKQRAF